MGITIENPALGTERSINKTKAQLVLRVACEERARAESDDDDDDDDDGGRNGDDGCVEHDENIAYSSSFAMSRVRVELEGLSADGSQILQKPKLQNESDADDPSLNAALSTIAQVVLLAECVAVRKKQADDGLRNWEMAPYLERVLTQAKSRPVVRASATVLVARHEDARANTRTRCCP